MLSRTNYSTPACPLSAWLPQLSEVYVQKLLPTDIDDDLALLVAIHLERQQKLRIVVSSQTLYTHSHQYTAELASYERLPRRLSNF